MRPSDARGKQTVVRPRSEGPMGSAGAGGWVARNHATRVFHNLPTPAALFPQKQERRGAPDGSARREVCTRNIRPTKREDDGSPWQSWRLFNQISVGVAAADTNQHSDAQHDSHLDRDAEPDVPLGSSQPTDRAGNQSRRWRERGCRRWRDRRWCATAGFRFLQLLKSLTLRLERCGRLPFADPVVPKEIGRQQLLRVREPV